MGEPIEMRDTKPVRPGHNVRLTLDANIQDRAEQVLNEVGKTWKPKGATAIVMDPNSGAILALANWPRVNANALEDAPEYARQNRAIGATYEPGSTFKAFTVAAALEDGKVTPDTKFNLPPILKVADREIKDAEAHGYETRSVSDILKVSSNIGAVLIAQRVRTAPFDAWIHKWGFGKPTGVDLPGEEQGLVLPLKDYSGATMGNLPIGQGIAVTPMQMAAGLRRDRQRRHPAPAAHRRLRRRQDDQAAGRPARDLRGHRGLGAQDARGRARPGRHRLRRRDQGLHLAGKTGTAEKAINGDVLQGQVRRVVRRLRARREAEAAGRRRWSTSPTARSTAARSPRRPGSEIVNFALGYLKIAPELDFGRGRRSLATSPSRSRTSTCSRGTPPLREALEREGAGWAIERVREAGRGRRPRPRRQAHSRRAERNEPRLVTHDRFGHRVDQVELDPSWHWLLDGAVARGIHALPWADPRPGAHVARAALEFMWTHANAGVMCPISMTYSAVPALRVDPEIAAEWEPRLLARRAVRDGDDREAGRLGRARQHHPAPSRSATAGTSSPATSGSAPIRRATSSSCSPRRLAGLSCFVLERGAGMEFQRLKDKLGTRSLPSSEVEFRAAPARLLGEEGRGVATIIEMVTHTRLDCVIGSASGMRRGVAEAIWHARHRSAFGARLVEQPAMVNVLADLALESEAATATALRLARAYDEGDHALRRFATAIAKYWVCKRATPHAVEALECLGGNGYVEESPMPRLLRDAPLNGIWEGSGNVIALDVLRALAREPDGSGGVPGRVRARARRQRAAGRAPRRAAAPTSTRGARGAAVEELALAFQASLLVRYAPAFVADAFCAARLGERRARLRHAARRAWTARRSSPGR